MVHRIQPDRFDAVLFDLDGVLTSTAKLHAAAWKEAFDRFLRAHAETTGQTFRPFDIATDYARHVDGRLRQDGVRAFLTSRKISLPEGKMDDAPGFETLHAVGNMKNERFQELLQQGGLEVFEGSLRLVHFLRSCGMKTAVVTASRNGATILEAAHIQDLFDVRVDGVVAAEFGLPGKPAPDTFLKAAELLQVPPARAVVVEDALSGVVAGRSGGFGLVIGVDRKQHGEELREHGADWVVQDLSELLED